MSGVEKRAERISRPYRVRRGGTFRLKRFDPSDTGGLSDKKRAKEALARGI